MTRSKYVPALIVGACILGGASVLAFTRPDPPQERKADAGISAEAAAATQTYADLATAIIAIEQAEDQLVKTILIGDQTAAQRHLRAAKGASGAALKSALEAAANEISNIANEGDKGIRAVRQQLAEAGHTHNTDVQTKEDYMFITNREKKELLALAQKVASGNSESAADEASKELTQLFNKAIAPE